jgi:hypothetical protein
MNHLDNEKRARIIQLPNRVMLYPRYRSHDWRCQENRSPALVEVGMVCADYQHRVFRNLVGPIANYAFVSK